MKFERAKLLALPTISLKNMPVGHSRYFEAQSDIVTKDDTDDKGQATEISLLHVIDLESGEEGEIVLGFIVKQALEQVDELPGLKFGMTKGKTKNRTTEWQVFEVTVSE